MTHASDSLYAVILVIISIIQSVILPVSIMVLCPDPIKGLLCMNHRNKLSSIQLTFSSGAFLVHTDLQ